MTQTSISLQLQPLLAVQEYDRTLEGLRTERERWPAAIQTRRDALNEFEARLQAHTDRRTALQMERDRLQLEIKEELDHIQTYEKHIREIKTNREYQALLREVGISKKAKYDAEEASVRVLQELEIVEADIAAAEEEIGHVRHDLETLTAEADREVSRLDASIAEYEAKRTAETAKIAGPHLARYQLVRRKHSTVLVHAAKGACTGCRRQLPPQTFNRILRDDEMITCPFCHRILLPPAPVDSASA
jgi:predicted  nucleic acid-binding Zn-ribbon protein